MVYVYMYMINMYMFPHMAVILTTIVFAMQLRGGATLKRSLQIKIVHSINCKMKLIYKCHIAVYYIRLIKDKL